MHSISTTNEVFNFKIAFPGEKKALLISFLKINSSIFLSFLLHSLV